MIIKTYNLVISLMLCATFIVITNFSAGNNAYAKNENGDTSLLECASVGGQEFLQFMEFFIYSGSFSDAYFEPFVDISRSQCQASDIIYLKNQKQKIIKNARKLFLECEYKKAQKLKTAIVQTNAEIYYARKIVDTTGFRTMPSIVQSDSYRKSLEYNIDKLDKEVRENYFNNSLLTTDELNAYMTKLHNKYESRKKKYLDCDHGSWDSVKEKFSEFIDSYGGTKKAATQLGNTVGRVANNIKNAKDDLIKSASNITLESTVDSLIVSNLNDLTFKEGVDEVYNDFSKLNITPGSTYTQVIDQINNVSKTIVIEEIQNRLSSEFQAKYSQGSDASVSIITKKLELIDKTLKDTVTEVSSLKKCVSTINTKQCAN